jgi:pectate lyase
VNRRGFLATPLALAACAGLQPRRGPSGWAAAEGGIGIGSVRPEDRLDIRSRADLDRAMALGDVPKLLRVHGRIDLSGGRGAADFADREFDFDAYCRTYAPETWGRRALAGPLEEARKRSAARQGAAVTVKVAPRTVLVGATPDAGFADGTLVLQDTHEVVLGNLRLHGVRDHFPAWDPLDGARGDWNSEYDAVSLRRARRVWVDHCDFESAHPAHERIFGRVLETNDGLLDITLASDLVTVSWCRFARHDKTMLIGGSDRHVADEGHLRVTLHHNLWEDCAERTPRVRFGKVHIANNLFVVTPGAHYGYSIGLGLKARIVSEDNAWETGPEIDASRLARPWGGTQLCDRGSLHNGRPLDLGTALRRAHPGLALDERAAFDPPPIDDHRSAAEVAAQVRGGAGAGRPAIDDPVA